MKDWSVRLKVSLGVGIAIVLLAFSGWFSYYSLSQNVRSFSDHEELVDNTVFIEKLRYNVMSVRMNTFDILYALDEKKMQNYQQLVTQTKALLADNLARIKNPDSLEMIHEIVEQVENLERQFAQAAELIRLNNAQDDIVFGAGERLESRLTEALDLSSASAVAPNVRQSLLGLLQARLEVAHFMKHAPNASAGSMHEKIQSMSRSFEQQISTIENRSLSEKLWAIAGEMTAYGNAVSVMSDLDSQLALTIGELNRKAPYLFEALDKTEQNFTTKQVSVAESYHTGSASRKMLIATLFSLAIVAITIAGVLIIRAVTKPLNQAEKFAIAVANGDFSQDISLGQKDEVGKICHALQLIKETVAAVATEVEGIVVRIEQGNLLATGDSSKFNGGFADMVGGINTLVATFENLIGQLPLGIMAVTADHRIKYLNAKGMQMAGINSFEGKTCSDLFNTEDCKSSNCATDKCIQSKLQESSETIARPSTGEYNIGYSSLPLRTRSGEIAGALELIIDQTSIITSQNTMIRVAQQANAIANQVASTSEEMAAQVQQVSNGAEEQQQQVVGTASSMEEMNSTVLEVARNASEASTQSNAAKDKATEGAEMVNQVVAAVNQVKGVAEQLQDNIEQLGRQAESIGDVMIVISDIADQTNLLALNAAIEAARAGDAGRGFAVVADEVRKLAEKTMEATKDVGENILAIQSATAESTKSVESAVNSVTLATELADNSGEALVDIVHLSTVSSDLISSIATAAEQQSATSEEINRAIEHVNRVVSETTAGMVQSSIAVQNLAEMSKKLKEVLNELQKDQS